MRNINYEIILLIKTLAILIGFILLYSCLKNDKFRKLGDFFILNNQDYRLIIRKLNNIKEEKSNLKMHRSFFLSMKKITAYKCFYTTNDTINLTNYNLESFTNYIYLATKDTVINKKKYYTFALLNSKDEPVMRQDFIRMSDGQLFFLYGNWNYSNRIDSLKNRRQGDLIYLDSMLFPKKYNEIGRNDQLFIDFNNINLKGRKFISSSIGTDSIYYNDEYYWEDVNDTLYKFNLEQTIPSMNHVTKNYINTIILGEKVGIFFFEKMVNQKKCKCLLSQQ